MPLPLHQVDVTTLFISTTVTFALAVMCEIFVYQLHNYVGPTVTEFY